MLLIHKSIWLSSNLQTPLLGEKEQTACCLCCKSGPIKLTAQIDKGGYVPGETIWVTATCDNNSERNIHSLAVQLVQVRKNENSEVKLINKTRICNACAVIREIYLEWIGINPAYRARKSNCAEHSVFPQSPLITLGFFGPIARVTY